MFSSSSYLRCCSWSQRLHPPEVEAVVEGRFGVLAERLLAAQQVLPAVGKVAMGRAKVSKAIITE